MVERYGMPGSEDRLKGSFSGNPHKGRDEFNPPRSGNEAQDTRVLSASSSEVPKEDTKNAFFENADDSSQDGSWSSTSPSERIEL